MLPLLTIFTPTYNRKKLLHNLYDSLKVQTSNNFLWMIIDDGSTDDTEKAVNEWIDECKEFRIEYYKKENGGLQSGYVEAIKHLRTELAMCIDSDDQAMPNTVELVEKAWAECDHKQFAGLFGLDCFEDGTVLGGRFSPERKTVDLIPLSLGKEKRTPPDRALVIRSELYRMAKPAKRYLGERTMNATYLHLQIAEEYQFVILNEPLIQVEYQADGLTKTKKKHFVTAPNTYADWRLYMLSLKGGSIAFYFRNAIHYVSSCIFAKRKVFCKECHHKGIVFFSLPFGFLLHQYLKRIV